LWEGTDAAGVRSKILSGDRPHRPESEEKHTLTVELWRIFAKCWGKDPDSRISLTEALNALQYLWVLNSLRRVPPTDSLYDPSPQQRSGASYNLEKLNARGKDQPSQELIEELDKGGHSPFATTSPRLIGGNRCWKRTWYIRKRNPNF
jgi:hypothetical protein